MTWTLEEGVLDRLKKLSEDTMIPQARLMEKAITDFMNSYEEIEKALNNLPTMESKNVNK